MIASQSKRPDLAAESDDQHQDHAAPEKQLLGWQGEIAREAQQGRGIDALQRVLSELKKEFGVDDAFLFPAIDELQKCADRHLSDHHELETISCIFQAIFPEINSSLDDETIKIDLESEIRRLAKLTLIEYELVRQDAAAELGIGRVSALDNAVKAARAEHDDTKGQGRLLKLPAIEPWSETVNGADLLDDIVNTIRVYLVLPEGGAEILAWWAVHTHVFDASGIRHDWR
jgi:hypothetical protein